MGKACCNIKSTILAQKFYFCSLMMNDPINFTDEHFQRQNSGSCDLLIHLDADSYSYAIVDKEQNSLMALVKKHFGESTGTFSAYDRLEILKAENNDVNLAFAKVKISVEAKAFAFVPEDLYSADDLPKYSKFIGAEPKSALLTTEIQPFGIKNITAVDTDLEINLRNSFANPIICSQANPFLLGVYALLNEAKANQLFLNIKRNSFEAAVIRNNTLEFYNFFEISNTDEFNYFILNLISQLNIDQSLAVTLSGEIDEQNELYETLQKYFEHLFFAETELVKNVSEIPAPHRFFTLLSLNQCE